MDSNLHCSIFSKYLQVNTAIKSDNNHNSYRRHRCDRLRIRSYCSCYNCYDDSFRENDSAYCYIHMNPQTDSRSLKVTLRRPCWQWKYLRKQKRSYHTANQDMLSYPLYFYNDITHLCASMYKDCWGIFLPMKPKVHCLPAYKEPSFWTC